MQAHFEWDPGKDLGNQTKHGVSFEEAVAAFADPDRIFVEDVDHSGEESRYYCIGRVRRGILMVRFTWRGTAIRIFGAGFWRKGKEIYENQGPVHR